MAENMFKQGDKVKLVLLREGRIEDVTVMSKASSSEWYVEANDGTAWRAREDWLRVPSEDDEAEKVDYYEAAESK